MSFSEKIAQIMARPGQDPNAKDDVPWWMRYAGRGLGTAGSFLAIFLGFWNCLGIITIDMGCVISGMWQILAGFIVVCCEAPCCCMFIDHVQRLSEKVEARPYWNKAAAYVGLAIPAIILCPGLASIFGSGMIFGTGVIYGMMSLGKKGSREDMAAMASPQMATSPTGMGGGMGAASDHHTTLMEDPDVWRPT
ncbi:calcium channel flower isoform X2 [Atheta coriaria]|uniref:calcium channel flower isoform X2 n=1 Tax=Dalotia coriaria TaxID=877792 RepID=UPI0031F43B7C